MAGSAAAVDAVESLLGGRDVGLGAGIIGDGLADFGQIDQHAWSTGGCSGRDCGGGGLVDRILVSEVPGESDGDGDGTEGGGRNMGIERTEDGLVSVPYESVEIVLPLAQAA